MSVDGNTLVVNGKKIRLTQERDPANLKWNEVGADVVIESTGLFLDKASAEKHLGRRRQEGHHVGAPKDDTPMFVFGVNRQDLRRPGHHLQRLVHHQLPGPVAKVLNDNWGIKRGLMTTVHAATATQKTVDGPQQRTGAAAAASWKTSSQQHRRRQGRWAW